MAFQAGAIVSKLTLDRTQFTASVKGVQKQTRMLGGWVKQNSEQFRKMGKAIAVAGGLMAGAFAKLVWEASKAEEIQSKFFAVFKSEAPSALKFIDEFAASVGRSRIDLMEWMATLQDTFVPLGFARDKARLFSQTLTQLAVDLASFNNQAEPDVIRDLQSAIVGNHETMRKYGVIITEATIAQELLNMGIKRSQDEVTAAEKAQARLNIIIKGTADAQGDAIRTSTSFANVIRRLEARIRDLQVGIGDELLPAASAFISMIIEGTSDIQKSSKSIASAFLTFFKLTAKGLEGLILLFQRFQEMVFEMGAGIARFFRRYVENLIIGFALLKKIGIPVVGVLKSLLEAWVNLAVIEEGYNETREKHIESMTKTIEIFDELFESLNKIETGMEKTKVATDEGAESMDNLKKVSEKVSTTWVTMADLGKVIWEKVKPSDKLTDKLLETQLRISGLGDEMLKLSQIAKIVAKEMEEAWINVFWNIHSDAMLFINSLSSLFSQLNQTQLAFINQEYEARKTAIEASKMTETSKAKAIEKLETDTAKKRAKAEARAARLSKAVALMEAIVHTASAIVQALPNIPLAILVGAMGAVQTALIAGTPVPTFQRGGRITERGGIVGEAGPELFVPERPGVIVPLRETRGGRVLPRVEINFSPTFNISTLDPMTTRDVVRQQIMPAMVEALKNKIQLSQLQSALGVY